VAQQIIGSLIESGYGTCQSTAVELIRRGLLGSEQFIDNYFQQRKPRRLHVILQKLGERAENFPFSLIEN